MTVVFTDVGHCVQKGLIYSTLAFLDLFRSTRLLLFSHCSHGSCSTVYLSCFWHFEKHLVFFI